MIPTVCANVIVGIPPECF